VSQLARESPVVQLAQAYLDGINKFVAEGPTPIEFLLTGLKKEPFSMTDIYNSVGYMAFSFAMAHKTVPLLTNIKDKLGADYLKVLEIDVDPNTIWIKNYGPTSSDPIQNSITILTAKALAGLSLPLFEGSNS